MSLTKVAMSHVMRATQVDRAMGTLRHHLPESSASMFQQHLRPQTPHSGQVQVSGSCTFSLSGSLLLGIQCDQAHPVHLPGACKARLLRLRIPSWRRVSLPAPYTLASLSDSVQREVCECKSVCDGSCLQANAWARPQSGPANRADWSSDLFTPTCESKFNPHV